MRQLPLITGAVCALAMAATAEAQTTVERVWIDVNAGSAWAAEDTFLMTASVDRSHEQAEFAAHYHIPRAVSFDFGGGVMLDAAPRCRHQRRRQRARGAGGPVRAAAAPVLPRGLRDRQRPDRYPDAAHRAQPPPADDAGGAADPALPPARVRRPELLPDRAGFGHRHRLPPVLFRALARSTPPN